MAEVINRGRIIIDLEAGKVDLPQPNYDAILTGQARHAEAANRVNQALEQQARAYDQIAAKSKQQSGWGGLSGMGRESLRENQGDKKWDAGLDRMKAAAAAAGEAERAELEKANQLILADRVRRQQQEEAINQQILADRVRRHQQNLARIEAEKRAEQQAIQERIAQQRAMNESLNNVAEGFMKVTRSAVLLGFAQDESLQDLLRNLALAQGAFDLFQGSRKIIQGVREAMAQAALQGKSLWQVLGAGNATLALTAAAVTAVAMAWDLANRKQKAYEQGAKQSRDAGRSIDQDIATLASPGERLRMAEEAARTHSPYQDFSKRGNAAGGFAELAAQAQKNLLEAYKGEVDIKDNLLSREQQMIRNAERRLELTENQADAERDAVRAVESAYSQLQDFEQKQLKAAADKLKAGGDINEYERGLFEKAGQSGIVETSRAAEGRREGSQEFIDKIKGLEGATTGTSGSLSQLQAEADKLAKKLAELTEGKGADAAIAVIEQQRDELKREFAEFQKDIFNALRAIREGLRDAQKKNADIANAATGGGGIGGGGF